MNQNETIETKHFIDLGDEQLAETSGAGRAYDYGRTAGAAIKHPFRAGFDFIRGFLDG
ncbi:hypothetical protein LZC95_31520 [Pendulispora brunnea]|uniref:Uncharacterized protein n=1 Tax=Pendulispora brunnea TaxID=2905690 RepID=A0ABZ2JX89_9BACT